MVIESVYYLNFIQQVWLDVANTANFRSSVRLQFSVGRIHRQLGKGNYGEGVEALAPIYIAAVM